MAKKKMNMKDLARLLCELEGGATEVNIAQMCEILKNLCVLMVDEPEVIALMIKNGCSK